MVLTRSARITRPRGRLGASVAAALASIGAVVAATQVQTHAEPLAIAGVLGLFIAAVFAYAALQRRVRGADAELVVDAGGVSLGGERLVERAAIERAYVTPLPGYTALRLERRNLPPLDLDVETPEQGTAALEILGFDVAHRAMRFRPSSTSLVNPTGYVLAVAALSVVGFFLGAGLSSTVLRVAGLVGFALACAPALLRSTADVGTDGILLRTGLRSVLVPLDDVAHVQTAVAPDESKVLVTRKSDGVTLEIVFASAEGESLCPEAAALRERIAEVQRLHHRGATPADLGLLGRGELAVPAWIAALRELGGHDETFRKVGLGVDVLLRAVEDVTASPVIRAAAAVALRPHLDAPRRLRVEAVASASATPKLRVALEAAMADDEDAIAESLAALDEESAARR